MPSRNIYFKDGETCESLGKYGFIETTGVCASWSPLDNDIMLEPIDSNKEATGDCCVRMTITALKRIVELIEKDKELKECTEYIEIGDTIKIRRTTYECIAGRTCEGCSFDDMPYICDFMCCGDDEREDATSVIFKQVEE